jgi:hypothetical protein
MFTKLMKIAPLAVLVSIVAFSTESFAIETRCEAITNIQPKVNEIHQFISDTKDMEKAEFDIAISQLNDSVNALYETAYNCDPYMDNLLEQMLGAVDTIRNSHAS